MAMYRLEFVQLSIRGHRWKAQEKMPHRCHQLITTLIRMNMVVITYIVKFHSVPIVATVEVC